MTSEREDARRSRGASRRGTTVPTDRSRSRTVNVVVAVVVTLLVVAGFVAATVLGGSEGAGTLAGADPTTQEPPAAQAEETAAGVVDEADDARCEDVDAPVADPVQVDEVPDPLTGTWTVSMATTCGEIVMELDGDAAPQGVGSFVGLAQEGFFDSTPCHRLTTSGIFVLQCGDPTGTGTGGPGYRFGPVENAPADDVYPAGTVAMARVAGDGESMGSQFFLVYEDSTIPSDAAGGYTVLGTVTEGLDIVRLVAEGGLAADGIAPARSIAINSVTAEESA